MARGSRGGADPADTTKDLIATSAAIASGDYAGQKIALALVAYGPDTAPVVVDLTNGLPIKLDAAALAALETTELGASSLAALESITAAISNALDLSVATLAALESITIGTALPAGTNAIGNVGHDNTGLADGRKIVTTAGTRVALAASTPAKAVIITAETDNTGIIVVGGAASVVAALATRTGTPLNAGDSIILPVDNLADVGLDSTVSGDGVTYGYTS